MILPSWGSSTSRSGSRRLLEAVLDFALLLVDTADFRSTASGLLGVGLAKAHLLSLAHSATGLGRTWWDGSSLCERVHSSWLDEVRQTIARHGEIIFLKCEQLAYAAEDIVPDCTAHNGR